MEAPKPQEINRKVWQSREILKGGDVELMRAELKKHIASIDVTPDGRVYMQTKKFGIFEDSKVELGNETTAQGGPARSRPDGIAGARWTRG